MYAIPEPGLYRHYKGGLYTVLGPIIDSDTGEKKILYHGYGRYDDIEFEDPSFVRSCEERYKPVIDINSDHTLIRYEKAIPIDGGSWGMLYQCGKYCIKSCRGEYPNLLYEKSILELLWSTGYTFVSRPVSYHLSPENCQQYLVLERINAKPLAQVRSTYNLNTKKHLVISCIRQLHEVYSHQYQGFIEPIQRHIVNHMGQGFISTEYKKDLEYRIQYCNIHDDEKYVLCHGDLWIQNIMTDGDKVWIIDRANAGYGPISYDRLCLEQSLKYALQESDTDPQVIAEREWTSMMISMFDICK